MKPSHPVAKTEKKAEGAPDGEAASAQASLTSGKGDESVAIGAASQPDVAAGAIETPGPQATSTDSSETAIVLAAAPAAKQAPSIAPPTSDAASNAQPDASTPDASQDPKAAASEPKTASAPAQTGGTKPQANVQTAAAPQAGPDAKPNAPIPTPADSATALSDLLATARGPVDVARAAPAHQAMQSAPQAVAQVYTRFVERFDGRAQRFEVQLDPAELGRVDVRIEIGADKKVHAVLAAHDSAALNDLMRGQRALERALTDAGVNLKDGGVKFELANDPNRSLAGQDQRRDAWSSEERNVWRGFSTVDVGIEADAPIAVNSYRRASRFDLVA